METKFYHRLRPEIIDKIKTYPMLQYSIRDALNISHSSLYRLLNVNDIRLTTWDVLFAIWLYLSENEGFKGKITDLLETYKKENTAPQHTPGSVQNTKN